MIENEVVVEMENRDYHRFTQRLRLLTYARKLNFADVMKDCSLPSNTLYRYDNGTRKPDAKTLAKLAVYFGVSIDWLLGLDEYEGEDAELLTLYHRAYPQDRQAIMAILSKYNVSEEVENDSGE